MKSHTQAFLLGLCAALGLVTAPAAFGQASLTSSGYTQNFSSMGTGTTAPTGWSAVSEAGSHFTFMPTVAGETTSGTPVDPNFTAGALSTSPIEVLTPTQGSGTGKGVDGVNYVNSAANITAGEGTRSFGTDPSGNAATILELSLTNNTGSDLTALNLSYDIDRFTTVSDTNSAPSGFLNSSVEELPGYQLFYNLTPSNAATWVNVSSLNPTINMGTTGAVQVPNTVGITAIPSTTILLGGTVANGSTFALAWLDDNGYAPSPDQEIALNNISVQAAPEPSSIALGLTAACLAGVLLRRRRLA